MQRKPGDDAVSPLIATILLIAIAVALAAIVFTISRNLAEETIPDPPPSAAFTVRDHPHRMDDTENKTLDPNNPSSRYTANDCRDILFSITVDEDIRLRDYTLRIGQQDAFLDVWGENTTTVGNIHDNFKLFVDGFPPGQGGTDYELDVRSNSQHPDGDDIILAGQTFILREVLYPYPEPVNDMSPTPEEEAALRAAHAKNDACAFFGFGDDIQVRLVHASGTVLRDITLKLQ